MGALSHQTRPPIHTQSKALTGKAAKTETTEPSETSSRMVYL